MKFLKCGTGEQEGGRSVVPIMLKKKVVQRIQEERKVLRKTKLRKANWIGHVLGRNWLLKHIIESTIERTGRYGRGRKQLLHDFKEWEDTRR